MFRRLASGARDPYSATVPEQPNTGEAEQEAALAAAFYAKLIADGVDERAAREMATGYVIARQRRRDPEPWELPDSE